MRLNPSSTNTFQVFLYPGWTMTVTTVDISLVKITKNGYSWSENWLTHNQVLLKRLRSGIWYTVYPCHEWTCTINFVKHSQFPVLKFQIYRGTLRLRFEPIWLSYFQSLLSDWYHSPLSLSFWTFLFFQWKTMNVQNKSDIGEWYQFRFLTNWRHLIKIGNNLIR